MTSGGPILIGAYVSRGEKTRVDKVGPSAVELNLAQELR